MLRLRLLFRSSFALRSGGCRSASSKSSYAADFDDYDNADDDRMDDFQGVGAREREVVKDVYKQSNITAGRSQEEVDNFMKKNSITVLGRDIPKPILTIGELEVPEPLKAQFVKHDFNTPTPIQSLAWPMALSGKDMIGIAQTGSGKTLGYLLPSAVHIASQPKTDLCGPMALVLAPTRELVQQICSVASQWVRNSMRLRNVAVYGGAGRFPQIEQLRRNVEICVATPGRLKDLLDSRETTLGNASFLVLDEADRMLDMGFEPQIRDIIQRMRPDRQTVMFSATWPTEVRDLAADFMEKDFIRMNVGSTELCANPNVRQKIVFLKSPQEKEAYLLEYVHDHRNEKILVFAGTQQRVEFLSRLMMSQGIRCVQSHGRLSQTSRDRALHLFRSTANVMVATDVASRGLDVSNITTVVNFDFPQTIEDYIHRIGRTARHTSQGTSITFFSKLDNSAFAKPLIKVLTQANQEVPDTLKAIAEESSESAPGFRRAYDTRKPFKRLSVQSNWRNAARRF